MTSFKDLCKEVNEEKRRWQEIREGLSSIAVAGDIRATHPAISDRVWWFDDDELCMEIERTGDLLRGEHAVNELRTAIYGDKYKVEL